MKSKIFFRILVYFWLFHKLLLANGKGKPPKKFTFIYPTDTVPKNWTKILVKRLEHDLNLSDMKLICEDSKEIDKIQLNLMISEFSKKYSVVNINSRELFVERKHWRDPVDQRQWSLLHHWSPTLLVFFMSGSEFGPKFSNFHANIDFHFKIDLKERFLVIIVQKSFNTSLVREIERFMKSWTHIVLTVILVSTVPSYIRYDVFYEKFVYGRLNNSVAIFPDWLVNANGKKFVALETGAENRIKYLEETEHSYNFREYDIAFCKHVFVKHLNFTWLYVSKYRRPDFDYDYRYYTGSIWRKGRSFHSVLLFSEAVGIAIPKIENRANYLLQKPGNIFLPLIIFFDHIVDFPYCCKDFSLSTSKLELF